MPKNSTYLKICKALNYFCFELETTSAKVEIFVFAYDRKGLNKKDPIPPAKSNQFKNKKVHKCVWLAFCIK
jgi:hypothetical protein